MYYATKLFGLFLFQIEGVLDWFSLLPSFIEISVLNANSIDPDQMLQNQGVQNLIKLLANMTIKFLSYIEIFAEEMWIAYAFTHIFN